MGRQILITSKDQGLKHDSGKPAWGLLPWVEMDFVVKVLTFGAKKYKPGNWMHVHGGEERYFDACLRHLSAVKRGEWLDRETKLPHYAHALCSLLFAFWHGRRRGHGKANGNSTSKQQG